MRSLTILALAAAANAQSNHFEIYSGCTNFTSRGTLGANAGEILIQVPGSNFAGVCQDATGTGTSLESFQYVTQDQNGATQSTYTMLVRADAAGQPDATAAGVLLRLGPLVTPPSTTTTPIAWVLTTALATPSTGLPLCGTYYHGMEVEAAPLWSVDGQSVHICSYFLMGVTQADNPAPPPNPVPNVAWSIDYAANLVNQPAPRALRLGLGSPGPVLNMGNVDPYVSFQNCVMTMGYRSWGAGGIWPCSNSNRGGIRDDGLDARVRDAANANGAFAMFASSHFVCPGLPAPGGWFGAVYLSLPAMEYLAAGVIDAQGVGIVTLLQPGTPVPLAVLGRAIPFQAFTLGPSMIGPGRLTNVAATTYL